MSNPFTLISIQFIPHEARRDTYLIYFRDRVLVDWDLSINTSSRIAIPMPNTTKFFASLVDLALEAQLPKVVHQIHTSESSTNNQHIGLEVLVISVVIRIFCSVLVRSTDIRTVVNHYVRLAIRIYAIE